MQEQMQGGFDHISRQIRALSSSLEPQIDQPRRQIESNQPRRQIESNQPRRQIESNRRTSIQYDHDDETDDIEEIIPVESDEEEYYCDEKLKQEQEVAQKRFEKDHQKKIRVRFIFIFSLFI